MLFSIFFYLCIIPKGRKATLQHNKMNYAERFITYLILLLMKKNKFIIGQGRRDCLAVRIAEKILKESTSL